MSKILYTIFISILFPNAIFPQKISLDIHQVLQIAQKQSSDYQYILNQSLINEIEKRQFRIRLFPKLDFSATIPSLNEGFSAITMPDGSDSYINRFILHSNAGLSLSQYIPFTGGTVSMTSSMNALYNINPQKDYSFNFNMINFSYSQQLSSYNEYKWDKRLFEKRQEIKNYTHYQNLESINQKAISYFFNSYIEQAKKELNIMLLNVSKLTLEKARKLYAQNQIMEEDWIESQINYQQMLKQAQDSTKLISQDLLLKNYLNISKDISIQLEFNDSVLIHTDFIIDKEEIIRRALKYSLKTANAYTIIEKEKEMRSSRAANGPSFNVSLSGGLNTATEVFKDILHTPNRQFNVLFSMSIPILDWGAWKMQNKLLKIQYDEILMQYDDKERQLIVEINNDIENLMSLKKDLIIDREIIVLQLKRIQIIQKHLNFGKVDIQKLIEARTSLMQQNISYYNKLNTLLTLIYKYRRTALWDIQTNTPIYNE